MWHFYFFPQSNELKPSHQLIQHDQYSQKLPQRYC
uniref:Uncharacterized protein n=1 Tax=Rhizophora mucronata TaxID=61149 RepID=A0A2P2PY09_RHIMU